MKIKLFDTLVIFCGVGFFVTSYLVPMPLLMDSRFGNSVFALFLIGISGSLWVMGVSTIFDRWDSHNRFEQSLCFGLPATIIISAAPTMNPMAVFVGLIVALVSMSGGFFFHLIGKSILKRIDHDELPATS